MVSVETKITAAFILLGVVSWYVSTQFTDNTVVQIAVLVGVGIVIPTAINELR